MKNIFISALIGGIGNSISSIVVMLAIVFVVENRAEANVGFRCYSNPGRPKLAYEYASGNCGALNSAKAAPLVGKDTIDPDRKNKKDIVCIIEAACEPVVENMSPPLKTQAGIEARIKSGYLKFANLICKGEGQIVDGNINKSSCPDVESCQKDIFFNMSTHELTPMRPELINVPGRVVR